MAPFIQTIAQAMESAFRPVWARARGDTTVSSLNNTQYKYIGVTPRNLTTVNLLDKLTTSSGTITWDWFAVLSPRANTSQHPHFVNMPDGG